MESLVFPRFDYACVVYHPLNKTRIGKIEVTLTACVPFVVGRLPFLAPRNPSSAQTALALRNQAA